MQTQSLIPSSEDTVYHALDGVAADAMALLSTEISPVAHISNPQNCEARFLPFLAHSSKVDFWKDEFSEQEKRDFIKRSKLLHQRKGTVWAVEEVLELLNYTDRENGLFAEIKEGLILNSRDGTYRYDGIYNHGSHDDWAKYVIYVPLPITRYKAETARKLIEAYAPKRSHLVAVVYGELGLRDGSYSYDDSILHGNIGVKHG